MPRLALRHLVRRTSTSQILWFLIGAAAGSCCMKYVQVRRDCATWSQRWHHCVRSSIRLPAVPSTPDTPFSWIYRGVPKAINNIPPGDPFPIHWNEEKESLVAFYRQAGEQLAAFSNATLDKVPLAVLALNEKLAQRRSDREKRWQKRTEISTS